MLFSAGASEAAPTADPLNSSSVAAAIATLTAPSMTRQVKVTPEAAPASDGFTAAWVATFASAHPRPSPTPVTRKNGA
jgi:hypothetical protein